MAGKRGSSKSRPLCKHCLFRVEYCCPSKAFTEVNMLQPWRTQRRWQWITSASCHHTTLLFCHWLSHTHFSILSEKAPSCVISENKFPSCSSGFQLTVIPADWQPNPADGNTLAAKALSGNRKSMCAAALSTARLHWVKMINLSIHWYPPGPNYHCYALKESHIHWSA